MDVNTRPNEVFAYLAAALDMQNGFGLCYLFSDDAMGSSWLNNRLQEHVEHDQQLKPSSKFETVFASSDIGSTVTQLCRSTQERAIVWCYLPSDKVTCQATLVRMNEQRQRLLASGHFFVLLAPTAFEHEVPQWAADLWAVRTLLYRWQRTGRMVESSVSISWGTADTKASPAWVHKSTTAIEAWQRIYAAWQLQPNAKQLSVDLGLLASAQASKLRQFDLAVTLAQQTLEVASTHSGRANALQALGDLKSRLGQVAEAQALYLQAIGLYEKEQDDLGRANALQAVGNLKSRLGQVDEAQALYLQAIGLFEKEQNDLGRANALKTLGDLKRRLGQLDEAHLLYLQAVGLYEKEQDDLGRANALKALGDLKRRLGQVDEAQALYLQAIGLYEKEQDNLGRANALRALGDLKNHLGQINAAQALYLHSIGLYEKEQNDLGRANALRALGDLKSHLGQLDEAQALYLQAIGLFEKERNDLGRANALKALGDLKRHLDQVDEAQALYLQAIGLYEKGQADLGRANALQALGDLKRRLDQPDEAQALYLHAIGLYEKEQDDLGLGYAWAELALFWATDAALQRQAADAAKKAFRHIGKTGSPPAKEQVKQRLTAAGFIDFHE